MTATEFPAACYFAGVPLYVTEDGCIRSVLDRTGTRYPSCEVAAATGTPPAGYGLGWDGCKALGMTDGEATVLLTATNPPTLRPHRPDVQAVRDSLLRLARGEV